MFSLTVCFGPQATAWAFMFKTQESLNKAIEKFPGVSAIADDFGQWATFERPIHGYIIEDMNLSKLAHQERAIHMERMKAAVTQQVQTDPALRAGRAGNGPAIVSPFGGQPR